MQANHDFTHRLLYTGVDDVKVTYLKKVRKKLNSHIRQYLDTFICNILSQPTEASVKKIGRNIFLNTQ